MTSPETDETEPIFRDVIGRFWILRLVIEVREGGIFVRLAPIERSFRRIPADQIRDVSVTTYAATTFAGWHWGVRRTPGGNTVYRLRGGQGVEIVWLDDERWFIGSQRPSELKSAIEKIRTPATG